MANTGLGLIFPVQSGHWGVGGFGYWEKIRCSTPLPQYPITQISSSEWEIIILIRYKLCCFMATSPEALCRFSKSNYMRSNYGYKENQNIKL